MNYLLNNLVLIICILLVVAIIVRFSIRSYYVEKRRHLSIMMHSGDVDTTNLSSDHRWNDLVKKKEK